MNFLDSWISTLESTRESITLIERHDNTTLTVSHERPRNYTCSAIPCFVDEWKFHLVLLRVCRVRVETTRLSMKILVVFVAKIARLLEVRGRICMIVKIIARSKGTSEWKHWLGRPSCSKDGNEEQWRLCLVVWKTSWFKKVSCSSSCLRYNRAFQCCDDSAFLNFGAKFRN